MEQPLPAHSQPTGSGSQEAAEKAFRSFIYAAQRKNAQGILSGTGTRMTFSFETWLREKGYDEQLIALYCRQVRVSDYIKRVSVDLDRQRAKSNRKVFLLSMLLATVGGIVIYLLAALVMKLFGVSIWSFQHVIWFIAGAIVLMCLKWGRLYIKTSKEYRAAIKQKAAQQQAADKPYYYIQIFDNDPVTFS
jgi:hypothetical protein